MMTFKTHIDAMKQREKDLRFKADQYLQRADQLQQEWLSLQNFLDRKKEEENDRKV